MRRTPAALLLVTVLAVVVGIAIGIGITRPTVEAAGGKVADPNGVAPDRYVYYPGTEALGADELRIIACGTGMPAARRGQAASCWVFELGNGDKFIFDIGEGSAERLAALEIPYDWLDKVFIGHLHGDHFGDLGALFVGGGIAGRHSPLRVWGESLPWHLAMGLTTVTSERHPPPFTCSCFPIQTFARSPKKAHACF